MYESLKHRCNLVSEKFGLIKNGAVHVSAMALFFLCTLRIECVEVLKNGD